MASKKGGKGGAASSSEDDTTRIAIIEAERCKPKKCAQECKKGCPVVKLGKRCIVVEPSSTAAELSESLCIGCGICVKKVCLDVFHCILLIIFASQDQLEDSSFFVSLHQYSTQQQFM